MTWIPRHRAARAIVALQLVLLPLSLTACGQVFVGFFSNPPIPSSSVTGTISTVTVSSVNDSNGNSLEVTTVSFLNAGLGSTLTFCGDQRIRFPVNELVRVDFSPGTNCLFLVNVVVN